MWESINFRGRFEQVVFAHYREVKGVMVPVPDLETGHLISYCTYDAFERDDLIPSLVRLVRRASRKGNAKKAIKAWIRANGFLVAPITSTEGEPLEKFWQEAVALARLWRMYQEAVNRDAEALKGYCKVKVERLTPDEIENEEFFWGEGNDGRVCVTGYLFLTEAAFGVRLKGIEQDPLAPYQFAVLHYIAGQICSKITNVRIRYDNLSKEMDADHDSFSVSAYLQPDSLLQALYLQFLQLLTEKRRVCPTCFKSFVPRRANARYCSDACRFTASTRKRRNGQAEEERS